MRAERRWWTGAALASAALLVGGCASMPDSGDVQPVDSSPRTDSRVRVFALAPREGAEPVEVVEGFLEALTSEDPDYAVARKYLTEDASRAWRPEQSTTVLTDGAGVHSEGEGGSEKDRKEYTFTLTGQEVARVDSRLAYRPHEQSYEKSIHLVRGTKGDKGDQEWRIDRPPAGVVLGRLDFQRLYWAVNKYYFGARSVNGTQAQQRLVADPIYVRSWEDPVTVTVRELLKGPTSWLSGVADSPFPEGTRLRKGTKSLAPDDQNLLVVPLNKTSKDVHLGQCRQMAAQLIYSLKDLTSTSVDQVELRGENDTQLCVVDDEQADNLVTSRTAGHAAYQYFLDKEHRLVRMSGRADSRTTEVRVPGPLGEGEQSLRSAAVSLDEERAAGVSLDGKRLFTAELGGKESLDTAGVRSTAKDEKDRLSTPSWDGFGDLWIADRDPRAPRLLWLNQGAGEPVEVPVAGLGAKARIESVRVSADGVRIALLIRDGGTTSLRTGRIERSGTAEHPKVSVAGLRSAAPQMEEVTAMSWAGGSRLVVVGRESRGVQQLRYVQSDGSVPAKASLPGLTGVTDVASSGDAGQPLIAHSDDGIVRLPAGGNWQTVFKDGTAPFYPG